MPENDCVKHRSKSSKTIYNSASLNKRSRKRSRRSRSKFSRGLNLRKGTLSRFGYHTNKSMVERRQSLNRAVREYGPTVVIRKLIVVAVLSKNRSPKNASIYNKDRAYV